MSYVRNHKRRSLSIGFRGISTPYGVLFHVLLTENPACSNQQSRVRGPPIGEPHTLIITGLMERGRIAESKAGGKQKGGERMTCKDWKALTPAERRAYEMGYKAAMKAQQKRA